jgi:hypothetical protein
LFNSCLLLLKTLLRAFATEMFKPSDGLAYLLGADTSNVWCNRMNALVAIPNVEIILANDSFVGKRIKNGQFLGDDHHGSSTEIRTCQKPSLGIGNQQFP